MEENYQPLLLNIGYNPFVHGRPIGIQFGCFVFQNTIGKWYYFRHPRQMQKGPRWTFYYHPGFQMDTPPGMSSDSWRKWVERQRKGLKGKLHKYIHEGDGQDIEEEWTEVNSVVFAKMFRVKRLSETVLSYLQQKLEQFAKMNPDRVAKQEEENK